MTTSKAAGRPQPQNQKEGVLLTATPIDVHHAWMIARERAKGHDHCRKAQETIGSPSEQALAEHYGALAEVVTLAALFRDKLTPQKWQLVAQRAPSGPDFVLCGLTYQIKSVPPDKRFLCINEQQRLNPRHASDFVLPVVFTTPTTLRLLRPIVFAEVSKWELRQGHSPYRSVAVASLPVLNSLGALIRA